MTGPLPDKILAKKTEEKGEEEGRETQEEKR